MAALDIERLTLPFAHTGHTLLSIAYAAPVIGMLVWLGIVKVREVRERRRDVG